MTRTRRRTAKQENQPRAQWECHFEQAQFQNNTAHASIGFPCIECHMRAIKTAQGDAEKFNGDFRTHRMAIDPTQIEQTVTITDTQGTAAQVINPQISLNFACRHCHGAGLGTPKTDEELITAATGYHEPPAP
jgi:ribosomal protein L44E